MVDHQNGGALGQHEDFFQVVPGDDALRREKRTAGERLADQGQHVLPRGHDKIVFRKAGDFVDAGTAYRYLASDDIVDGIAQEFIDPLVQRQYQQPFVRRIHRASPY